ncbi:hypothetical protein CSSP291_21303 (plasmid) [Cronobacter sakazakii SP291]|nr:hypothetical protein CSSP291_21303 [Cronobacter sakazakii SP291]
MPGLMVRDVNHWLKGKRQFVGTAGVRYPQFYPHKTFTTGGIKLETVIPGVNLKALGISVGRSISMKSVEKFHSRTN